MNVDGWVVTYCVSAIVVLCAAVQLIARWRTRRQGEQFELEVDPDAKMFERWKESIDREITKAQGVRQPEVSQVVARPPASVTDVHLGAVAKTTVDHRPPRDCCCSCEDDHE